MNAETRIIDLTVQDLKGVIFKLVKDALKEYEHDKTCVQSIGGDDVLKGIKELAKYLKVSEMSAWRKVRTGMFDDAKTELGPRTVYFSKKKITELLNLQKNENKETINQELQGNP